MDVSIIIVNYNTLKITKECIDSIFSYTKGISFEVILVDNASQDGSKDFFENYKSIKYIYNFENLGFGKANNLGLKSATGKYIYFLNSDTLLLNDAVSILFNKMEETGENVACLGSLLLDEHQNYTHSYGDFPTVFSELIGNTFLNKLLIDTGLIKSAYDNPSLQTSDFFKVDYVTGAAFLVKREVIDELGCFDPDFFMYYEESEMQKRFYENNKMSYIMKGPKIIHLEGASSIKNKNKKPNLMKRAMALKGCFLYFKKTESTLISKIFRFFLFILSLPIMFSMKYTVNDKRNYLTNILIDN